MVLAQTCTQVTIDLFVGKRRLDTRVDRGARGEMRQEKKRNLPNDTLRASIHSRIQSSLYPQTDTGLVPSHATWKGPSKEFSSEPLWERRELKKKTTANTGR